MNWLAAQRSRERLVLNDVPYRVSPKIAKHAREKRRDYLARKK